MEYKTYKTIDEQIDYLKENKKIIVDTEDKHWLKDVNYISLINPYKEIFANGKNKEGKHIYPNYVNFKELLKVMKIDYEFSAKAYNDIRDFERKLKNLVIIEICNKYKHILNDSFCIQYVYEIKNFIDNPSDSTLPLFCPNFYLTVTKKGMYKNDMTNEIRFSLLKKIYSYGSSGKGEKDKEDSKHNKLISHYIKTQKIVPLWAIPNVLTLGEICMLFNMLDIELQNKICLNFGEPPINFDEVTEYKRLAKFSGKLEFIRNIRNTINHYEPVFPNFCAMIKKPKELNNSIIVSSLKLLDKNAQFSNKTFNNETTLDINVTISPNNIIPIRVLELMKEYMNI